MHYKVSSEKELKSLIPNIFQTYKGQKLWLFYGEIGAGKTTFIKYLCHYLKIEDIVTSPTFSIINEYHVPRGNELLGNLFVFHIDLYRVKSLDEALSIGIEEYIYGDELCFIEWPEIIEPILPPHFLKLSLELIDDSGRKIIILEMNEPRSI